MNDLQLKVNTWLQTPRRVYNDESFTTQIHEYTLICDCVRVVELEDPDRGPEVIVSTIIYPLREFVDMMLNSSDMYSPWIVTREIVSQLL